MATNETSKSVNTEPEGAIDSILTYLKERIESPFLMSFLFSWSVINRDFLFYLFMSEDSKKHYQLANWDFSGFIFNFGKLSWYSPWADSLWWPVIFGVSMTVLFSPLSMFLAGWRYFVLSKVTSFTQSNKDGFDTAYSIKLAQKKLESLKVEINDSKKLLDKQMTTLENYTTKASGIKRNVHFAKLGVLTPFLIDAARFAVKYKSGDNTQFTQSKKQKIESNSVIKISIRYALFPNGKVRTGSFTDEIDNFEGCVFDFFSDEKYFNLDEESSVETMDYLINDVHINREFTFDIEPNKKAVLVLHESTVYET